MPVKEEVTNGVNGHHKGSVNSTIPTLVKVDPHVPGSSQANIHTRWHPDIPYVRVTALKRAGLTDKMCSRCPTWRGVQGGMYRLLRRTDGE
jgi:hypothetical protein